MLFVPLVFLFGIQDVLLDHCLIPVDFGIFFSHDKCQCIATILLLIYLYTRSGSLKVIENIYPTLSNKNPQQNVKATLQGSGTWVDGKVLVEVDDKRQVIMRNNS